MFKKKLVIQDYIYECSILHLYILLQFFAFKIKLNETQGNHKKNHVNMNNKISF